MNMLVCKHNKTFEAVILISIIIIWSTHLVPIHVFGPFSSGMVVTELIDESRK